MLLSNNAVIFNTGPDNESPNVVRQTTMEEKPNKSMKEKRLEKYHVTIATGDKMFAGTDNDLNMVFTDIKGFNSAPIKIRNQRGALFQRNSMNQKEIGINYRDPDISDMMTQFKEGHKNVNTIPTTFLLQIPPKNLGFCKQVWL